MTTPDIDLLRRLYVDEQKTISQVAASLGIAPQTVDNRLVAAEIPRRPSPSTPRADLKHGMIRRLYVDRNWSASEIAAHFGCGTSTVYTRLARMALPGDLRARAGIADPATTNCGGPTLAEA